MSVGQDDWEEGEFAPGYGIVYSGPHNFIAAKNDEATTMVKGNTGSLAKEKVEQYSRIALTQGRAQVCAV